MKQLVALVTLSFFACTAWAGAEDFAQLEGLLQGQTFDRMHLVPKGYVKVAEAKGDLSGDGVDDLAILVQESPRLSRLSAKDRDDAEKPQAVVLYLGTKTGSYSFWKLGRRHFSPAYLNQMEENGVGVFAIRKQVLIMNNSVAMSMGGWGAGGCTQKWRNEKAGLRLIGLTTVDFSRACACGTSDDTNFVTGLNIKTDNRGPDGQQIEKEKTTKTKVEPKILLWEDFDFDKMCTSH